MADGTGNGWLRRWLLAEGEDYRTTRFVLLRGLGFIYLLAYLCLAMQVKPLLGENGILPARLFIDRVLAGLHGSRLDAFLEIPSVFWAGCSDGALQALAWLGVAASAAVMLGATHAVLMAALWFLYLSFVHVGQRWYGYGWETMLLEAGFLAIFWCPLRSCSPRPRGGLSPLLPLLFRWMIFRVMFGAGLIKIRGDDCWRDLTCLAFHYETQPIPNPLSWYLHHLPMWFHEAGCLFNHFVELVVPFFYFAPRRLRHHAGFLTILFQALLILSGNLSFLNWLTIVITIPCFDDSAFAWLSRRLAARDRSPGTPGRGGPPSASRSHRLTAGVLAAGVALLSIQPVMNLLSRNQIMNSSFDRLSLVNTYGAFGSVGKVRHEIILEGSADGVTWKPYEFLAKPGNPRRRPALLAPYHSRVDWQIWFSAMSEPSREPWLIHFIYLLLKNDRDALGLLAHHPFPGAPPRFIRCEFYEYHFSRDRSDGAWWTRSYLGPWLPALSADDPQLRHFIRANGWKE